MINLKIGRFVTLQQRKSRAGNLFGACQFPDKRARQDAFAHPQSSKQGKGISLLGKMRQFLPEPDGIGFSRCQKIESFVFVHQNPQMPFFLGFLGLIILISGFCAFKILQSSGR